MVSDFQKLQRIPRQVSRWQSAQQRLLGGQAGSALRSYRELVQRFPGVPQLWFELGIAAMGALDFLLAERAFRRAEELAPGDASLLTLLGQQYYLLRRLEQARACFERAAAVEPGSVHARLSLAAWYERERRFEEARQSVDACLLDHPRDARARYLRALLLQRQGCSSEAETALRDLLSQGSPDSEVRVSSLHLLAVVLDGLGNYEEAMKRLDEAKAEQRRLPGLARMQQDYDTAAQARRELLAGLTSNHLKRWRDEAPTPEAQPRLALLGGHPRSGTTLLEQILNRQPELESFDESPAFVQEIWHALAPMPAPEPLRLETLDRLPPSRCAELRARYFKSLLRQTQSKTGAAVLLDKNPSPTGALHLWLRVFPELKVLIALRDPRDVVVSSFFQDLKLTPTNANFLSLEGTAKHYADLMDVWLRLRELSGFEWIETRYEDVVASPESEGRRVTEFLGLGWHEQQARYYEGASGRFVFSPTYAEATQPVYQRAVGRWHHYAAALEPLQQRLLPYCRAFGYRA